LIGRQVEFAGQMTESEASVMAAEAVCAFGALLGVKTKATESKGSCDRYCEKCWFHYCLVSSVLVLEGVTAGRFRRLQKKFPPRGYS
jgi:hypothetical protein